MIAITHNPAFARSLEATHVLRVRDGQVSLAPNYGLTAADFDHTAPPVPMARAAASEQAAGSSGADNPRKVRSVCHVLAGSSRVMFAELKLATRMRLTGENCRTRRETAACQQSRLLDGRMCSDRFGVPVRRPRLPPCPWGAAAWPRLCRVRRHLRRTWTGGQRGARRQATLTLSRARPRRALSA